jgi:hypothetical protein
MEYVGPPRGAMNLLRFFASESDFDTVIGDLSEEFQQQVAAFGQAAARRWYWRETVRNASAFATRELLRTPVTVLVITVLIFVGLWFAIFLGDQFLESVRWVWVPPRFWRWYQAGVVQFLFPALLVTGTGVFASRFLRGRELSLIVTFATVFACMQLYGLWGFIRNSAQAAKGTYLSVAQVSERMLISWFLAMFLYSLGCLWIRWRRLQGHI